MYLLLLKVHLALSFVIPGYLAVKHNRNVPNEPIPEIYEPYFMKKITFL